MELLRRPLESTSFAEGIEELPRKGLSMALLRETLFLFPQFALSNCRSEDMPVLVNQLGTKGTGEAGQATFSIPFLKDSRFRFAVAYSG